VSEIFQSEDKTSEMLENEKNLFEQFVLTTSAESFSALFKILYPRILKYFLARKMDLMIAEELTQNVMFTLYERIGDLREKDLFYGWLFKIARNEWLQYIRQQQRRNKIVEFEPLDEQNPANMAAETGLPFTARFYEWMESLDQDEKEIIMLRFIDGLSYEELAVAIQIPLGTVKWRIFNAKKKLAQIIMVTLLVVSVVPLWN
jgi:RNA polymerase sigma-70 factor (ECF subfamily)